MGNPYAAKSQPAVIEADTTPKPAKEKKVEAVSEVPTGSVKEVLAWVDADADKAKKALDAENASDSPRKTLVKDLEEIVNG